MGSRRNNPRQRTRALGTGILTQDNALGAWAVEETTQDIPVEALGTGVITQDNTPVGALGTGILTQDNALGAWAMGPVTQDNTSILN